MPSHTRGDIDVVLCHTLVIFIIDVAHVYQRIAHLILSAIDKGVDYLTDALVSHDMNVDGQTLGISLACQLGHFLFRPVGNALVSVGIEGIHNSRTSFYSTVEEELDPSGHDTLRSELLGINGSAQCLVHIHPALNLVGQS